MILEPADSNPDTTAWMQLLSKLTSTTRGLFLVDFTEKRTSEIPKIVAGSMFELNGSFYQVPADEEIVNYNSVGNGFTYAYAEAMGSGIARFFFDGTPPEYQVQKGGWYHPEQNMRCLMSCYKQSNTLCRTKALIGAETPFFSEPIDTTGVQIANTNTIQRIIKMDVEAGYYRVVIKGANGGNGGTGGTAGQTRRWTNSTNSTTESNPQIGTEGSAGSTGQTKEIILWLDKGSVTLIAGRTGTNGANGANGETSPSQAGYAGWKTGGMGGSGGNGADGEDSILLNNGKIVVIQPGGNGGIGGNGGQATRLASAQVYVQDELTGGLRPILSHNLSIHEVMSANPNRQANGANGANGSGYLSASITGSVSLFAL